MDIYFIFDSNINYKCNNILVRDTNYKFVTILEVIMQSRKTISPYDDLREFLREVELI